MYDYKDAVYPIHHSNNHVLIIGTPSAHLSTLTQLIANQASDPEPACYSCRQNIGLAMIALQLAALAVYLLAIAIKVARVLSRAAWPEGLCWAPPSPDQRFANTVFQLLGQRRKVSCLYHSTVVATVPVSAWSRSEMKAIAAWIVMLGSSVGQLMLDTG